MCIRDSSNGADIRTFDVAIVCTGEFYQANGASTAAVNTVITNSVNAIQAFFERELAVEFNLLTPKLYTNPATDPFDPSTNTPRTIMAADAIGDNFNVADYDIGHLFHDQDQAPAELGGGGIAALGVICNDGNVGTTGRQKGRGWSSSFDNTSSAWYRLAAHEFGHQFGAQHTFNGTSTGPNCQAPNHPINTAYEIGSGTTIMSYRNICDAAQNVPSSGAADDYFHANSLEVMISKINSVSCASTTTSGNTPPTADAGADYTIPRSTPFELEGDGTDANGDALTYVWEQYNEDDEVYGTNSTATHGKIGSTAAADSGAPLFRSVPPSENPIRTFPDWREIADGNNTGLDFEALPTVARDMKFRLTVRDNNTTAGGVADDVMDITVEGGAGPFTISSQNTLTTWTADGSNTANITWNVNGTDASLVNASNVDIFFSTDGGETFPFSLAANTPNDGSHTITIPFYPTNRGRIKVKASNNIFFDMNNADITISSSSCNAFGSTFSPNVDVEEDEGAAALNLGLTADYGSILSSISGTLESSNPASTLAVEDNAGACLNFNGNITVADSYAFEVDTDGSYTFSKSAGTFLMNIYEFSFNEQTVCTNFLASNGSFNGASVGIGGSTNVTLDVGKTYVLAVTSFSSNSPTLPFNYTVSISGAGSVYDGPVDPGTSYNYTFAVVDQSNGNIQGFETSGDLSNSVAYPAGSYKVYGLSYLNTETLPAVGTSFSNFQSDLANLVLCGNLSNNCMSVIINGSCPANYTGANELTGSINGVEDYETNGDIESTQVLQSSAKVDYDSANSIELKAGFEVKVGAEFCILIDGCNAGMGGINVKEEEEKELDKKEEKEE